jgi:hypothetical protein
MANVLHSIAKEFVGVLLQWMLVVFVVAMALSALAVLIGVLLIARLTMESSTEIV